MDEKASEVILLEAMEKTAHAKAEPVKVGGEPQEGSHGNPEPQRILAHESQQDCASVLEQPLA